MKEKMSIPAKTRRGIMVLLEDQSRSLFGSIIGGGEEVNRWENVIRALLHDTLSQQGAKRPERLKKSPFHCGEELGPWGATGPGMDKTGRRGQCLRLPESPTRPLTRCP